MNYLIKILTIGIFLMLTSSVNINAQEYKVTGTPSFGDNSDIIDYKIPSELTPGQKYTVSITIVNTGTNLWSKVLNYSLKPYNHSDAMTAANTWGVSRVELPHDVNPSDKVTFQFDIIAPSASNQYGLQWAMTKDNNFFGEYTNNTINVNTASIPSGSNLTSIPTGSDQRGNNSEIVNVIVPESMTTGEKYKVIVTLKNTGDNEWISDSDNNKFSISPFTEPSDIIYPGWNSEQVFLSNPVAPGQTSEVEFYVTAPSDPGNYPLQWIIKNGGSNFGQKSNKVNVNVSRIGSSNVDGNYDASFIEQNVPTAMQFNELKEVSVTMSNTGSREWIIGKEQLVMIDAKKSPVTINVWNVGYAQLPENVKPGGLVTIILKVKPTEPGWQYFQCSMMKEDGTLFGNPSQSVEVIVSK